jgi:hypothetical protein
MFGGDGGYCAADPGKDGKTFYGEYVYLNIHRSDNGGASADYISGQYWNGTNWAWKPAPYVIKDAQMQRANFVAPFILDPNEPNRLLAGGMSLWRSNDAKAPLTTSSGPKWAPIKSPNGSEISAIAVAKGNSGIIWAGHNSGALYRTANGTADNPTWTPITTTPPLPSRFCTRITIDAGNPQVVYATFGGYSKNNIWMTTDNGASWKSISASLPEAPVYSVVVHPTQAKHLYAGTAVGVFASENGGVTWSPTNEGPTNCAVDELFWMGTTLVAVTHGRGMFKIDVP